MAKHLAAKASWEAANACLQFHGGFGFAAEYDVERKFRETRLYQVAPISTNLILSYVAEHVLGLPRSLLMAVRPLEGITVVALEHAIAAPFCTRQLADLGARVIKVERPGSGDFARGYDERVQRPGLALRLDQPLEGKPDARPQASAGGRGAGAAAREGRRAGAEPRARRGRAARPVASRRCTRRIRALIVCDISGYGDDPARPGPYRDKKAYDLLIQSESGFLSVTGTPEEPAKAGCSIADIAAGMYAYSNILAALIARGKTGHGRRIDVSMLESMVEWMGYPLYYAYRRRQRRRRAPAPRTRPSIPMVPSRPATARR